MLLDLVILILLGGTLVLLYNAEFTGLFADLGCVLVFGGLGFVCTGFGVSFDLFMFAWISCWVE